MTLRDATDEVIKGITMADIADEAKVKLQTLRASRLDPDNPHYRSGRPTQVQAALVALCKYEAARLTRLAHVIERMDL